MHCWVDNSVLLPIHTTLSKYFFKRIVSHYGADYRTNDQLSQNLNKQNQNFGYGYTHYAIIRSQRPKRVLCIGSMYGFIPYMMAKACMENKTGHVYFVDAGYDISNPSEKSTHFFGQGFWKKQSISRHFSYLLKSKYYLVLNLYE